MRLSARLVPLACALLLAAAALPARATITIVNLDGAGEGFNDPTPVAPVGGNPGVTVGQQRLNLFQHAAAIWDAILGSPVEIRIRANFDPLFCTGTSAVLGSAGPWIIETDTPNLPFAGTWFASAQANRLAGVDLTNTEDDIGTTFNSNIGTIGCLQDRSWYYGFDGNEGANGIDLLPVLLHEFGHGLGFLTTTDESDGTYFFGQPFVTDHFLMDDVSGEHWVEMTEAERMASGVNSGHLVWDGPAVTFAAPSRLGPRARVTATGALVGTFEAVQASFGAPLTTTGFTADVVEVNDGTGTGSDACETPFANAGAVAGRIALIDRGTCSFAIKATNAQANGAAGILFVNNVAGTPSTVSAVAPGVTIPIASVSLADGNAIRAALGGGTVTLTFDLDDTKLAGANDAGLVRMFAPNPAQPGSSISHWDVPAYPNLLMEPSINADLGDGIDLTFEAFYDIGWFPQLVAAPRPSDGDLAFTHGPNPSREGGVLRFRLPGEAQVELALYDVTGRRVTRLATGRLAAGPHAVRWSRLDDDGRRVPAGVYLARLRAGAVERTAHVVLVD